ncbi:hypothetical protein K504DRAFT_460495 [Pleomassaria siparia CBS 279.74]|uniref:Uncharacterized protein n=1 Tax=Pleomassaria siparia CBS 279.74 TaxID=1314801 RepID=A0A6G1JYE1_9PLEO|nr:hypothetical protein K504DRAFT_460495 [Pleomassaria siparia CBS 279.74]
MTSESEDNEPVPYGMPNHPRTTSLAEEMAGRRPTALDVTEGVRQLAMDDNPTHQRAGSPATSISVAESIRNAKRLSRQVRAGATSWSRPKFLKRAATAPPGALYLYSSANPQLPRRVISARVSQPGQSRSRSRSRKNWQSGLWCAPLPQSPPRGTPGSRFFMCRRKSSRKSIGKLGLGTKHGVWGVQATTATTSSYQMPSEALEGRVEQRSFSEKERVKRILKGKRMSFLNTKIIDFNARDLPNTPGSMVSTPVECYGTGGEGWSPESRAEAQRRRTLPANRWKHFFLALSPDIQQCEWMARSTSEVTVRPWKLKPRIQDVYAPGPIRMADNMSPTRRRGSFATPERFIGQMEGGSKRFSDMVALDSIVAFFHSIGVVGTSSEDGLDRFWEPDWKSSPVMRNPSPQRTGGSRVIPTPSCLAVASRGSATVSPTRVMQQQCQDPRPSANVRQRGRFGRLLNSATSML